MNGMVDMTNKAKIIPLGNVTRLDLPVNTVLDSAKDILEGVVILGFSKEDGSLYFGSTYADGGEVIWLLERCKLALLDMTSEEM
jgi:hypothetical protein